MAKKILIITAILLGIGFTIYRTSKSVSFGEYYIVDFEHTNNELNENEKDALIKILNLDCYTFEEPYFIEFTKIAYESFFQTESTCYILFKTNINNDLTYHHISQESSYIQKKDCGGYNEYVCRHSCMGTTVCKEYKVIREIVKKHYKWWETNGKSKADILNCIENY